MRSVTSLKLCCSMSKLTNAPVCLASASIGRSLRQTAREVPSGSIGSNWLKSADSFTDTFTRGIGPRSSRSIVGSSGSTFTSRVRPWSRSRYCFWTWSASASVMVASPSRSMVNASRRLRIARTASTASATFDPAMNFRAICFAPVCDANASPLPRMPLLGMSFVPHRAHHGSSSFASLRYSRRWRDTSAGRFRYGSVSTKRNSCTLRAGSCMPRPMSLSSSQARVNSTGPWRSSRAKISRPYCRVRVSRSGVMCVPKNLTPQPPSLRRKGEPDCRPS